MASPVAYERLKDFTQYALDHTADPFNASDHDAELDAIQVTLAGLLANRALIQRDDGAMANDSVHPDSLSTATLLLIEAAGSASGLADVVRGLWVTATAYTVGQIVQNSTTSYICGVAHTSGTFATDYAAGKWVILGETAAAGASAMSFAPTSTIAATNVQAAIEELDTESAALAGLATQVFSVADATAAAHAPSMGQIQKNTLKTAIGTGTADALLATIASGLTVLVDGMEFIIEAPGSNTLTAPTLNLTLGSTATGAKTIVKGNGVALIAGDIASNKCKFVYDLSSDKWILINPLYQVGVSATGSGAGQVKNLGLAFSVGGGALAVSVTTASGSTPTSGSPVEASMRSSSAAAGTFNVRTITAALGLTISSGSTLGHAAATLSKIHWYLIDNAGTLELAASTKFVGFSGIASTTAEGGAGGADSADEIYSATARSNVPLVWIGESTDSQVTAGSWLSVPVTVNTVADHVFDAMAPSEVIRIDATVSGNAMTLTLHPCVLDFRSPTLGSGAINRRVVSPAISTVISAGSTGGTASGVASRIYLLAIDFAGTIELAWINAAGSSSLIEGNLLSTTAEGGAGAADTLGTAYSTTGRANLPYRIVGYVESTQAVAGTWATAPSTIQGAGGLSLLSLYAGVGTQGQTFQNLSGSRAASTNYTNTTGRAILVILSVNTSTNCTLIFTINSVSGQGSTYPSSGGTTYAAFVVPNGLTYSAANNAGTSVIGAWMELR